MERRLGATRLTRVQQLKSDNVMKLRNLLVPVDGSQHAFDALDLTRPGR